MSELSAKQRQILEYMKAEVREKGYPPSVREICDAVGLKSTSTVHGHLSRLEKKEFDIVCHIHDEVVLEVPEGSSSVEEVNEIMAVCPDWCEGLPLKAAGFESTFYKKD